VAEQQAKRLYRSHNDVKLTGVLGGWAEYMGLDPSLVRIVYAIGTILTGFIPGILLYLLMAVIVPRQPSG
jgi:phage shock protein C